MFETKLKRIDKIENTLEKDYNESVREMIWESIALKLTEEVGY